MRGIAEEHFVGAQTDPFGAQPPGEIAAEGRGQPLHDDQPDGGADPDADLAVGEAALAVALPAELRLDPDLLELDGVRCPRRGLGLEEDAAVLLPDPAPAFVDLDARIETEQGCSIAQIFARGGEAAFRALEAAVIDALSSVYDPEIPVNIYELGLIYDLDIGANGRVTEEDVRTAASAPPYRPMGVRTPSTRYA